MRRPALLLAVALASGCATREPAAPAAPPPQVQAVPAPVAATPEPEPDAPGASRLRCDEALELRVHMLQDEVHLDGLPEGREVLLRDAGGVTPQQSVFSSPRVRAEFGLGPQGNEVVVHVLEPQARDLHCRPA